MDKNVVNVSYYDTEKQTGGQFQFCPEIGNAVIRNLIEANLNKPKGFKMCELKNIKLVALNVPSIAELYSQRMLAEKIKHSETEALKKLPKPLVIMFNAPPRAGKDTACEILMRKFPESVKYEYFKEYLYKESAKVLGLDFNFWASICQDGDLKDKPMLRFQAGEAEGSLTPRDVLINVAENVLKPKHGKDCIANATAQKIEKTIQQFRTEKGYNPIVVVPDLGFPYEADAVRAIIPSAEVAVVHIKREGYTFEGDSRNYVPKAKYRIENTTLKAFEESVLSILSTEVQDIMAKHCWLK